MQKYIAKEEYLIQFSNEEGPLVMSHLKSKGLSINDAEDLYASLNLDLFLKIKTLVPFLNSDSYLDFVRYFWGAVRLQVLNFRREIYRKPTLLPLEIELVDDSFENQDSLELRGELQTRVEQAILKLTPKLRAIASLAWMNPTNEKMSYKELAMILGISEEGVKKGLQRAKKQLRETLLNSTEHEEVTS